MKVRRTDSYDAFQFGVDAIPLGWTRRVTFTPNAADSIYELCRGTTFHEREAKAVCNGDFIVYDDERWAAYSPATFHAKFEIVDGEAGDEA